MRHLLTITVLLGAVWLAAQSSPSQKTPSASSSQTSRASTQSSTGDTSGQTTVEGCLNSSNGNYTLTSTSGRTSSQVTPHS